MKFGIVIVLLFTTALIPLTIPDVSAKCLDMDDCVDGPVFLSLKTQIHISTLLPNITCPNQDHILTERPNGKFACVTNNTAEKTEWHIHYRNMVDTKGKFPVAKFGTAVYLVPFEITGATLDDMTHQNQTLTVHVTPNDEYGVLSFQMPFDLLDGHFAYCHPENENSPNTPYVMIVDGVEHGLDKDVNSRGQTALNIPLYENSEIVDIIRTCSSSQNEFLKISTNDVTSDDCPLSSSSRCYTGTITEIIDGDSIRVNRTFISLALIDAPELDKEKGMKSRDLIETLCPVKSEVLVDQDDLRPLEGVGGRSVPSAVVYCNGVNLNEQLIESNYANLRSALCSVSEFTDEPWARDNGCSLYSFGVENED